MRNEKSAETGSFKERFALIIWSVMTPLQYMAGFAVYSILPVIFKDPGRLMTAQFIHPIAMRVLVGYEFHFLEGSREILKKNDALYGFIGGLAALFYLYRLPVTPPEMAMTLYFFWSIVINNDDFAEGFFTPFAKAAEKIFSSSRTAKTASLAACVAFGCISRHTEVVERVSFVIMAAGIAFIIVNLLIKLFRKKGALK